MKPDILVVFHYFQPFENFVKRRRFFKHDFCDQSCTRIGAVVHFCLNVSKCLGLSDIVRTYENSELSKVDSVAILGMECLDFHGMQKVFLRSMSIA